ncbi:MAG: hypothetical protein ACI85K_001775 [Hyphomicrobiaceae bacterium]|jgi:hypothetical protein
MMKTFLKRTLGIALLALATSCAASPGSSNVIPYTSDICIVTDNKLGSMGDPVVKVYGNQEVKFCCRPCVKEFEADQERFLAKLRK